MKAQFDISKVEEKSILIEGKSLYDTSSITTPGKFTFEDSATLNVVEQVSSDETEIITDYRFVEHTLNEEEPVDLVVINLDKDSLYKVKHIVLLNLNKFLTKYKLEYSSEALELPLTNLTSLYVTGDVESRVNGWYTLKTIFGQEIQNITTRYNQIPIPSLTNEVKNSKLEVTSSFMLFSVSVNLFITVEDDVYTITNENNLLDIATELENKILNYCIEINKIIIINDTQLLALLSNLYVTDLFGVYKLKSNTTIFNFNDVFSNFDEVNIEEFILLDSYDPYIVHYSETYTFLLASLQKCFYEINRVLLSNLTPSTCDKSKYQYLMYIRDLIWMGLNTIKYLIDLDKLLEALHVLEQLNACSGLCTSSNINITGGSGCGCNKNS